MPENKELKKLKQELLKSQTQLAIYIKAFENLYSKYYMLTDYKCYSKEMIINLAKDEVLQELLKKAN